MCFTKHSFRQKKTKETKGEIRMSRQRQKQLFKSMIDYYNAEKRDEFKAMTTGHRYTDDQKQFVFDLIKKIGIRATAKVLDIPRRTIHRWTAKHGVKVKRSPDWVYIRAGQRKKNQVFWSQICR